MWGGLPSPLAWWWALRDAIADLLRRRQPPEAL